MTKRVKRLCAVGFLFAAAIGTTGCNSIAKQPGRCVGCCYDQCIVPIGSPQNAVAERPLSVGTVQASKTTSTRAAQVTPVARQMAY